MPNQSVIGLPGFSLLNPSTWIPTFGNWCGPGWSAGERTTGKLTAQQIAVGGISINDRPSPVDLACKAHDLAYEAAAGQPNEKQLILQADVRLEQDIAALPWSSLTVQESAYVATLM